MKRVRFGGRGNQRGESEEMDRASGGGEPMTPEAEQNAHNEVLKPKIAKCGKHWSVEWNRKGDYYPMNICVPTWKEAVNKAAIVVIHKLHVGAK